jgi:nicotinamide riboside kinase
VEWVPEFVREYAERKAAPLELSDHGPIARGQIALEDEYRERTAQRSARLLVQDTDLLSTAVYCEHYYGQCDRWIGEAAHHRRPDLYLLMDIDIPWIADPLRDRGERREEIQDLFRAAVAASGAPFVLVTGETEARFLTARTAIDSLLLSGKV